MEILYKYTAMSHSASHVFLGVGSAPARWSACTPSPLIQALPARVAAGFPSPADDHAVQRLDLMQQLIRHPEATFMLRVRGDSMRDAGILDGAVLLVDRAIKPQAGHVVVAVIDGEFVCKTLVRTGQGQWGLRAAHPAYADRVPHDHETLEVWGVVVASVLQHT